MSEQTNHQQALQSLFDGGDDIAAEAQHGKPDQLQKA
jgi:hypothetical protein